MNPVSFLRSSWAAAGALALLLYAQIPHPRYVFENLVKDGPSGLPFAVGFELAVLMLVVRNMHRWSWLFAFLSVLINVVYYQLHGAAMWSAPLMHWGQWLFSVLPPLGIAMYSHIMGDSHTAHVALPAWVHVMQQWVQSKLQVMQPAIVHHVMSAVAVQEMVQDAEDVQPDALDKRERALNMMREGFKNAEIAVEVDAPLATVQSWRRRYFNMNGVHA